MERFNHVASFAPKVLKLFSPRFKKSFISIAFAVVFLASFSPVVLVAQNHFTQNYYSDSTDTWFDFYKRNVDSIYTYTNPDSVESKYFKQLKRMDLMYGIRSYPSGDMRNVQGGYVNYVHHFLSNAIDETNHVWENTDPEEPVNGVSGQMHRITFSPNYATDNTVYACSFYGGLWKSTDRGENWSNISLKDLPIQSAAGLIINPANSNHMILTTGQGDDDIIDAISINAGRLNPFYTTGIYYTANGGQNWTPINDGIISASNGLFNTHGVIRYITLIGNDAWLATTHGLIKSENVFQNAPTNVVWNLVWDGYINGQQDGDLQFRKILQGGGDTLYASGEDIYRSVNGGTTWQSIGIHAGFLNPASIENFPDTVYRINIANSPSEPSKIWANISGHKSAVNKGYSAWIVHGTPSSSNSYQWSLERIISGRAAPPWLAISVNPNNSNHCFYGGVDFHSSLRSNPYFAGGPLSGIYADHHSCTFEPINNSSNKPRIFITNHGGVDIGEYSTTADDYSFEHSNKGMKTGLVWSFDVSPNGKEIVLGKQDMGSRIFALEKTNTAILNSYGWRSIFDGLDSYIARFNPQYGKQVYTSSQHINEIFNYKYDFDLLSFIHNGNLVNGNAAFTIDLFPLNPAAPIEWEGVIQREAAGVFWPLGYDHENGKVYSAWTNIYEMLLPGFQTGSELISDYWILHSDIHDNLTNHLLKFNPNRTINSFTFSLKNNPRGYFSTAGSYEIRSFYGNSSSIPPYFPRLYKILGLANFTPTDVVIPNTSDPYYSSIINNGIWDFQAEITPAGVNLPITGIAVDPNNGTRLWIVYSGFDGANRIKHSTDAGTNWNDNYGSSELYGLPVNDIVYQEGTNDRIFIATDAGVFYCEKVNGTRTAWKKFGNLPACIVTELKINHCDGYLYASTYGRSVWKTPLLPSNDLTVIATGYHETWEHPRHLAGNIEIESGASLTITSELFMPAHGKIIVKPGGKLVVDGGRISNRCVMWRGIEVWGNKQERQLAQYQGVVELKNDALIENAEMAITTIRHTGNPYPYHVDWNTTGGIIKATDATFRNNIKDVEFLAYKHIIVANEVSNISFFNNCVFETTKMAIFSYDWDLKKNHVSLYRVNGVKFRGCTFQNISGNDYIATGIGAYEANFSVIPLCLSQPFPCLAFQPNSFIGLRRGVESYRSFNPQFSIQIEECLFEDNFGAIYLFAVPFAKVLKNEIIVPFEYVPYSFTKAPYGIYLDSCSWYRVEENNISGAGGEIHNSTSSVGIICFQSAIDNEMIYNNQLSQLTVGIEAIGSNRSNQGNLGLEIRCNDFDQTRHDIYIAPFKDIPDAGIKSIQGTFVPQSSEHLAGNTFSHSESGQGMILEDFWNSVAPFVYYHHHKKDQTYFAPGGIINQEDDRTENVVPIEYSTVVYEKEISCPSKIGNGIEEYLDSDSPELFDNYLAIIMSDALFHKAIYQSTIAMLIDGGNTPFLQSEVDQLTFINAWQLYAELISLSPFVSDEILAMLVSREYDFPEAMLRDILVLNSQALQNHEIWTELDDRFSQLPEYMMEQIMNAATDQTTGAQLLQEYINYYHSQYHTALRIRLHNRLTDTTGYFNSDSVFAILYEDSGMNSLLLESQLMFGIHDPNLLSSAAENWINRISDDALLPELSNWIEWMQEYLFNDNILFELDIDSLEQEIESNGYWGTLGAVQRTIASFRGVSNYEEPVLIPEATEHKRQINKRKSENHVLQISPNPATTHFSVYYRTNKIKEEKHIFLRDLNGKVYFTTRVFLAEDSIIIPTNDVSPGTYIVSIVVNGESLASEKLIIIKR